MHLNRVASLSLLLMLLTACQQPSVPSSAPAPIAARPIGEHANPPYTSVKEMMRAKLAHAQAVLEGISQSDFAQLETNANALHHLSTLSDWQVHRTMEYNQYSEEFRWNAKELARHAREKKLHAATLDYMAMSMSCVKCHDYMKQAGLVKADLAESLANSAIRP